MKFLHLSDLHIGKSVNGFSMLDEQRNAFKQIIGYIKSERPAAVIIAGDVYDRAVPSVEAVRVFDDFLTELARGETAVMLISGNHDSPERLNYASRLLSDKRLYLCGAFEDGIRKVVLNDEYGGINFWLLPFIKPSSVRGLIGECEAESYGDAVAAAIGAADIDYSARNVLVSHQFYTKQGVNPVRSESEMNPVGGLDAVNAGIIEKFDYAALGHLHGAQTVGNKCIRYAGSPIKYSFSECRQEKAAALIDIREKGRLTVTPLKLAPLHDMREIKGTFDKLISDEISSLADKEDYLRVILTDENEIIDPMGKLRRVYPNIMSLDFENPRTKIDVSMITTGSENVEKQSPYELFCEFFLAAQGSVMSEEQERIVKELLSDNE